jgi:hypothetical protein
MSDIAPELRKAIVGVRGKNIFTERTRKRGKNLFKGGNVLQVLVEEQPLDNWLVRFTVGASIVIKGEWTTVHKVLESMGKSCASRICPQLL